MIDTTMFGEGAAPERIQDIIKTFRWRWASTYTKTWPHQYVVRDRLSPSHKEWFDELVEFWRENSVKDWFWQTEVWYLTIGENVYWTGREDCPNIMNRCEIEESYPWLAKNAMIKQRLEERKL